MAKSLFRAIATLALVALAPTVAHAGPVLVGTEYTFDFSSAFRVDNLTTSNSMTFSAYKTSDAAKTPVALQVKVSAWSIDRNPFTPVRSYTYDQNMALSTASLNDVNDDIVTKATLALWDGGFGVVNAHESINGVPNHSIDNGIDQMSFDNRVSRYWSSVSTYSYDKYMVDFLTLQFSWDVDLDDIRTGWIGSGQTPDSDATIRFGTGSIGNPSNWAKDPNYPNEALDLTGAKVNGSSSSLDLSDYFNMNVNLNSPGPSSTGTRCVNNNQCGGTAQHGMIWLLGALYGTDSNDYFKLDALNVFTTPTVPEPSTWVSMILGFGMVGASLRRRKALDGKSTLAKV